LIGEDEFWQYEPVLDSVVILKESVSWYKQGSQTPLLFFPTSALAFAETLTKKSEQEALSFALKTWQGDGEYRRGEVEDDYYQLCFRNIEGHSLLNQQFQEMAKQFFQPLLQHRIAIQE
jgi:exonuclease V gamma subunit